MVIVSYSWYPAMTYVSNVRAGQHKKFRLLVGDRQWDTWGVHNIRKEKKYDSRTLVPAFIVRTRRSKVGNGK